MTPSSDDWIGLEIAEGRYKILGRIGQGSMGRVYLASDHHLETDVVLKFPVAADKAAAGPEFLDRFAREIRSLVQLSHPHVVKVFDVGALEGHPFIVMEFLAGGSLKDRTECRRLDVSRPRCRPSRSRTGCSRSPRHSISSMLRSTSIVTSSRRISCSTGTATRSWAISGSSRLWRCEEAGLAGQLADGAGLPAGHAQLRGTRNRHGPPIRWPGRPVFAGDDGARGPVRDQLHGGPTPSATVVNQTMVVPPALAELIPGIPQPTVRRCSAGAGQGPGRAFRELRGDGPRDPGGGSAGASVPSSGSSRRPSLTSRGEPGPRALPGLPAPMPVGREHAGGRVRCMRCQAISLCSLLSSNTVQLKLVEPAGATRPQASAAPIFVVEGPDDEPEPDPSAATVVAERPPRPC